MRKNAGMETFDDKTVVVTGAASGIGRGIAVRFAAAGAKVVACDVDATGLDETALAVREVGCSVDLEILDVRDEDAYNALASRVTADVLCLNAGVFRGGLIWESPRSDWDWVMSVNLHGVLNGLRAFVPGMIQRGAPAHIEITASMAGLIATGMSGIYTASKFAALAVAESLARDLQSVAAPIGVSVLCPSAVNTGIGSSQRNREEAVSNDAGAEAIEKILTDFCAAGLDPMDVGQMVVDAIRSDQFLVPTKDTFAEFIRVRSEALQRKELPPFQMFD